MRTTLISATLICLVLGIFISIKASRMSNESIPSKPVIGLPMESIRSLKIIRAAQFDKFLVPKKYDEVQADFDLRDFITSVSYHEDSEAPGFYDLEIGLTGAAKDRFKHEVSFSKQPKESVMIFVNGYCVRKISTAYNADIPINWSDIVFIARNLDELKMIFPPEVAKKIHK